MATTTVDRGNWTTPDAADLNAAARRYCTSQGWALSNGSYPIRPAEYHGRRDLAKAITSLGRGNMSTITVKQHIIKRAKAINAASLLPDAWK
jgi:hypothetical protein